MALSSQAEQLLGSAIRRIETRLRTQLHGGNAFARRLLAHAAAGRGKRLRARLTLLSARLCGLEGPRVERLAAAMELLHQATLIHDDVIDESRRRRHRLTLNARYGNQAAVLSGDLIFVKAVSLLLAGDYGSAINAIVVRAATDVCLGEIQELQFQQNPKLTPAQYLNIVSKKTASLMAAACESGAAAAQAKPDVCRQLQRYGYEFGIAFQIQDDLLDVVGRVAWLGKPVGADIQSGRITLPVIFGLRRCRGRNRQILSTAVRRGGLRTAPVRRLLERCGALAQARDLAQAYARRAQTALQKLPAGPARAALAELAEFAATRNY
jgi:octaprenyl-diphosphate synthase